MRISGTISTNSRLAPADLRRAAREAGYAVSSAAGGGAELRVPAALSERVFRLDIGDAEVRYRVRVPQLATLAVFFAVTLLFLAQAAGAGRCLLVAFLFAVAYWAVRLGYERRMRRIVAAVVPAKYVVVPELATAENIGWMNDPDVCSACGMPVNKYMTVCPGCRLTLGGSAPISSNANHTGAPGQRVRYARPHTAADA